MEIAKKRLFTWVKGKEKRMQIMFLYKESDMCIIYNICNRCITCNIGIYRKRKIIECKIRLLYNA